VNNLLKVANGLQTEGSKLKKSFPYKKEISETFFKHLYQLLVQTGKIS